MRVYEGILREYMTELAVIVNRLVTTKTYSIPTHLFTNSLTKIHLLTLCLRVGMYGNILSFYLSACMCNICMREYCFKMPVVVVVKDKLVEVGYLLAAIVFQPNFLVLFVYLFEIWLFEKNFLFKFFLCFT